MSARPWETPYVVEKRRLEAAFDVAQREALTASEAMLEEYAERRRVTLTTISLVRARFAALRAHQAAYEAHVAKAFAALPERVTS